MHPISKQLSTQKQNTMNNKIRGQINSPELQRKAINLISKDFDITYVRLLPYIDYVLKNNGVFDCAVLTPKELDILSEFEMKGFITISDNLITCTSKEFYAIMCEILWDAYVEHN